MVAPPKRPIAWDIYQEHLDEAAFLWTQWESALEAANYVPMEVAGGPEERLRAHLDGLVLGGKAVADKLLLPALAAEPELARPAAWALLAAEHGDHFDDVLAALAGAEPPLALALARALALSAHPAIASRFTALWKHAEPPLRAVILSVMETRDVAWASAQLPQTLTSPEPALLLPSLRLLRRAPTRDPAALTYLEYALAAPDPAVRAEAMATAVAVGSRTVWDHLRREVLLPEAGLLPMGLLALSPAPADRVLLHERLRDPATRRSALWALGFIGDVEAVDAALALCGDEEVAALAGEVFSTATGLVVDGPFAVPGKTAGPEVEEVKEDDPPPELLPEDDLLTPNPPALDAWWRQHRARWKPGQRYQQGQLRAREKLMAGLVGGAMWRRPVLAIELASTTRAPVTVDLRGWVGEQLRAFAADAAPAPRSAAARR
jgi:uncharacterized protein (TIGR02270 family)